MKKFALLLLMMLMTLGFAGQTFSQDTLAPLYLFTTGAGSITPFQSGELLEAGLSYEMTAIPDPGFVFSSWQPVNTIVTTEMTYDSSGSPLPPIASLIPSPGTLYSFEPELEFTMQPESVILDVPSVITITQDSGWQANFVPIPESTDEMLLAWGFMSLVLLRLRPPSTNLVSCDLAK